MTVNSTLDPAKVRQLTSRDRCDVCGAQAYVRAVLPSGHDLLFCGHHARANEAGVKAIAGTLVVAARTLGFSGCAPFVIYLPPRFSPVPQRVGSF